MVRRVARLLAVAAGLLLYWLLAAGLVLALLGWFAPPPVEHRPVDPDAPPGAQAATAVSNLRATEYTYEVTVERREDGRTRTTVYQYVEIDNRARVYFSRVRNPPGPVNRSRPPFRYFSAGMTGYRYVPGGVDPLRVLPHQRGRWTDETGLVYATTRNALAHPDRLREADPAVLAANRTHLVVRVTDDAAATEVGNPVDASGDDPNRTAALTLVVDRRTGVVDRAVYRRSRLDGTVVVRATWRVRAVGATHVQRPPGTLPPGPLEALYRLDLGLRTLSDWLAVSAPVADAGLPTALLSVGAGGRPPPAARPTVPEVSGP